jgi:hypothetical protein
MTVTKLFQPPTEVAFPSAVSEAAIFRDGARRVMVAANAVWDDFFADPGIDIGARNRHRAGRHARSQGLVVITGNLEEFRRVDGLRSQDWLDEGPR